MKGQAQNVWVFLLFLLAGIVLGGFLGSLVGNFSSLSWLNYGSKFGIPTPLVIDIGVLNLQFGFTIRFTVAGILGMIAAIFAYRKL